MTRPGYDSAQSFLTLLRDEVPPCTQVDLSKSDPFFPDTEVHYEANAQEGKAVCQSCPIKAACFAWGIQIGDQHGIYGGATPSERRAWVRKHGKAAPAPNRKARHQGEYRTLREAAENYADEIAARRERAA